MLTAADYIARAVARSYRNRGEVLAVDAPELLDALTLLFTQRYAQAAGYNPAVFLVQAVMAWDTDGWQIPANCDTVVLLQTPTAQAVNVVAIDNLAAEPSEPAVYRIGRRYRPAGNANDPTAVALSIWYTQQPVAFTATGDSPDAAWPQQFDTMIVVDLAVWLAIKDARGDDIAALEPEQARWNAQYVEWLQRESLGLVRQWPRFATPPAITMAKPPSA